ncbi:hypothetical protein ABZ722_18975 [Streptomyces longwoodensis]
MAVAVHRIVREVLPASRTPAVKPPTTEHDEAAWAAESFSRGVMRLHLK